MTQQKKLLVCIPADIKAEVLKQYLSNSVSFAKQIGADVHFLMPSDSQIDLGFAIKGISTPGLQEVKTVTHRVTCQSLVSSISKAVKRFSCDLVLVPSESMTRESEDERDIRAHLLEQTWVPILILSPQVRFARSPLEALLVPMSGEIRVSSALKFGLRLASWIHVPVDLLHVLSGETQTESRLETTGDQSHHEYRYLLDRILAEASPFAGPKERAQVRSLYNVQGTPSVEILKAVQDDRSRALIIEWHGSLIQGKARTLKNILRQIEVPVFLVRTESDRTSVLKIGPEDQAA